MRLLTLDFETFDPYIERKLGAGWVYGMNVVTSDFRVIGYSYITHDGIKGYNPITGHPDDVNLTTLRSLVEDHDGVIMHNASYDLGCLKFLGIYRQDLATYDTEVMARLYNSVEIRCSLDALSKKYIGRKKTNDELCDYVWESGLYAQYTYEKTSTVVQNRPASNSLLEKCAKSWLYKIQQANFDLTAKYAITDVECTLGLFEFYKKHGLDLDLAKRFSMLAHICIDYRTRGIRVDLKKAKRARANIRTKITKLKNELKEVLGWEPDINSAAKLSIVFDRLKIRYPYTEKGNPSITSKWMETVPHPVCQLIVKIKKYEGICKDFIEKIINMQIYSSPGQSDCGRVFPELNILRARTGRFSSSAPNIQNIPRRDEELGPICRGMFVPEEGETLFSLDFSNQEGRLQVHYADVMDLESGKALAAAWRNDPTLDLHQWVADLANISRDAAKAINLGLSYGMGLAKLAMMLGVDEETAAAIRDQYNETVPFLKELSDLCKHTLKRRGYIKTLLGRHSRLDASTEVNPGTGRFETKTFEYKGLNKLIQGSAVDQIVTVMELAHDMGIKVLAVVHDEVVMTGNKEQADKLKEIMETSVKLRVPVVVDVGMGPSWAEAH